MNFEQMRELLVVGEENNQKYATFQFIVLSQASELRNQDPSAFCQELGLPPSYVTAMRQSLALARVLQENNIKLVKFLE